MFLRPTLSLHPSLTSTSLNLTTSLEKDAGISNLPTHQDSLVPLVLDLMVTILGTIIHRLHGLMDNTIKFVAKLGILLLIVAHV